MFRRNFAVIALALSLLSALPLSSAKAALCYGDWKPVNFSGGWGEASTCVCGALQGAVGVDVVNYQGMIIASQGVGQVVIELGDYDGRFAKRASDHFWFYGNAPSWSVANIVLFDSDDFTWNAQYRAVCVTF